MNGSRLQRAVLGLFMTTPVAAGGASYYVNDSSLAGDVALPGCPTPAAGQGTAPCGSCAAPCALPQHLYDSAPLAPGDVVYLNAGTYLAPAGGKAPLLDLSTPSKAGSPGAPITFVGVADSRGKPLTILDGNGPLQGASTGVLVATSWIVLEKLAITNTWCPNGGKAPFGSGVFVAAAPLVGIELKQLEVYGTECVNGAPIDFESTANPCTGCRIADCTLHDNGVISPSGVGIWVWGPGGIEILRNQIFRGTPGSALYPAIVVTGTPNAVVQNNLVYGNGGAALDISDQFTPSDSVRVVNNTFWHNQLATNGNSLGEVALRAGATRVTLENNIIGPTKNVAVSVDASASISASDFNDFFVSGSASVGSVGAQLHSTLTAWQAATLKDGSSTTDDPFFVNADDFHLKSAGGRVGASGALVFDGVTSPLIDRGDPAMPVGLEPPPNGGRINIGAYGGTLQASRTPVALAISGAASLSGPAGVPLGVPLEVRVTTTTTGSAERDVAVVFSVASGGAAVTPYQALTDASGFARAIAVPGVGSSQIRAAIASGGAPPVNFTVTGWPSDAGMLDGGTSDGGEGDAGSGDGGPSSSVRIASTPPPEARCRVSYEYEPVLAGAGGARWSASGPPGLEVDPISGAVSWVPLRSQGGIHEVTLTAEADEGSAVQSFTIEVACPAGLELGTSCGCGAGGAAVALGALLLCAGRVGRRSATQRRRAPL